MGRQPAFWAACVAVVIVVLVVVVNLTGGGSPGHGKHTIVYSVGVTGTTSGVTIYYDDIHQNVQRIENARLPWQHTLSAVESTSGYRVGATLTGNSGHARLTCTLRVDGTVRMTRTTSAADAQVRCAS